MLSPSTKRMITNVVLLAALGGGGWYFYTHRAELSGDEKTECQLELETILAACTPACEGTGRKISAVREQVNFKKDPECMNNCSRERFGKPIPQCARRGRTPR